MPLRNEDCISHPLHTTKISVFHELILLCSAFWVQPATLRRHKPLVQLHKTPEQMHDSDKTHNRAAPGSANLARRHVPRAPV